MAVTEKLKSFIAQSVRVWRILKKPTGDEFKLVSKISALGILVLGLLGFLIMLVMRIFG